MTADRGHAQGPCVSRRPHGVRGLGSSARGDLAVRECSAAASHLERYSVLSTICSPTSCVPARRVPGSGRSGSSRGCVAMRKTKVLERRAARGMNAARPLSRESGRCEYLNSETRDAPAPGISAATSSSKSRSWVIPGASPKTTHVSWSLTSSTRPGICTNRSTALAPRGPTGTARHRMPWAGVRANARRRSHSSSAHGAGQSIVNAQVPGNHRLRIGIAPDIAETARVTVKIRSCRHRAGWP